MSVDPETTHMTDQKKLKKAVRARSAKTGESYTAARRQVLQAKAKIPAADSAAKRAAAPPASRGEVSDASARQQTGHGLDHWFAVLDDFDGATKGHTASARHLKQEHGIPGWYAQGITVAYERAHGLRAVNQACSGGFQVSVSKTLPAALEEVIAALAEPQRRAAWLSEADPALGEALQAALTGPKPKEIKRKGTESARLRYRWGKSTVELRLNAKPTGTTLAADNMDLVDAAEVDLRRAAWKEALEGLLRTLGS